MRDIDVEKNNLAIALNFKTRSNLKGLWVILRDYSLIFLIIFINIKFQKHFPLYLSVAFYLLSCWLIGAFQFAISECLLHEASHYNLFRTRILNKHSQILIAMPFFTTHKFFMDEHLIHHKFLMQKNDHLFQTYGFFKLLNKDGSYRKDINWLWVGCMRPILGISGFYYFIKNSSIFSFLLNKIISKQVGEHESPSKIQEEMFNKDFMLLIIFWIALLSSVFYYDYVFEFIIYWIIPLIWCCGAFLYWSEIVDHFEVDNKYGRTRNSSISNFFFHNNGYHMTHHKYPFVPFFSIKKVYNRTDKHSDIEACGNFFSFLLSQLRKQFCIQ